MEPSKSAHQALRSTSIIGGASAINIAVGLVRVKVAALLLGPSGIGLIGLLQSLLATGAAVAGMGLSSAGVRELAAASVDDERALAATRRAFFWGTAALASLGAAIFWLFRHPLAEHVLGDKDLSDEVGWLALGIALTIVSAAQLALLNGLRRIGDMARLSVYSAAAGTVAGVAALLLWAERGIIIYILAAPLTAAAMGWWVARRVRPISSPPTDFAQIRDRWRTLGRLGVMFMGASLSATLMLLATRAAVAQELGGVALGEFTAAWTISMTYIGFVLQALSTDYYPRLTAAIHDGEEANRLVNEQSEITLILGGPILVAM